MLKLWSGWAASFVLSASAIAWFVPQKPTPRPVQVTSTSEQQKAVRQAVLDYAGGVYGRDARRLQACAHPQLVRTSYALHQGAYLETRMQLADVVRWASEYNKDEPVPAAPQQDVTVFDVLDQTATAKLVAAWGIESLHLAKSQGKWVIVHALVQTPPATTPN